MNLTQADRYIFLKKIGSNNISGELAILDAHIFLENRQIKLAYYTHRWLNVGYYGHRTPWIEAHHIRGAIELGQWKLN